MFHMLEGWMLVPAMGVGAITFAAAVVVWGRRKDRRHASD